MNLILFGPPGAGKGTQSKLLQSYYGLTAFSMGERLRDEVQRKTIIGLDIKASMSTGQLINPYVVKDIFNQEVTKRNTNMIFDGFPRNLEQVVIFNDAITKNNIHINCIVIIHVTDDVLIKRITGRYSCLACNHIYNEFTHSPKKENICDICQGTDFTKRSDDSLKVLEDRISVYNNETVPVLSALKKTFNTCETDGSRSPEDVFKTIQQQVNKYL